jgi:hypothetical protein
MCVVVIASVRVLLHRSDFVGEQCECEASSYVYGKKL